MTTEQGAKRKKFLKPAERAAVKAELRETALAHPWKSRARSEAMQVVAKKYDISIAQARKILNRLHRAPTRRNGTTPKPATGADAGFITPVTSSDSPTTITLTIDGVEITLRGPRKNAGRIAGDLLVLNV